MACLILQRFSDCISLETINKITNAAHCSVICYNHFSFEFLFYLLTNIIFGNCQIIVY